MKEEELKKVWKSSPDEELVRLERSRLINDMQTDAGRWYKMSKSRNSIIVLIIVIGWIIILGMMAYTTPFLLSKIGVMLCILSFVYWIVRLRNRKKLKQRAYSETYIDYLHDIRDYLDGEKKFYNDILYWCFTTFLIGIILFHVGSFETLRELMLEFLIVAVGGIFAYYYHKRLLKKEIITRHDKVDELLKVMEEL